MVATRLSLYNGALVEHLGSRKLASLSESVESRRVLDSIWDRDFLDSCLEQGNWSFATRTVEVDYSPSVEPPFGFRRAFDKPTDWKRTVTISGDSYFRTGMNSNDYRDETGFWFCDLDTIWARYVSNDSEYGTDFSKWPTTFTRWVEVELAARAASRLKPGEEDRLIKKSRGMLIDARSKDAMSNGPDVPRLSGWTTSRFGGTGLPYRRWW